MEEIYPIKEIKIMDGVYLWKQDKSQNIDKKNNNNATNINNKYNNCLNTEKKSIGENQYICHGTDELVKIYEIEFEEIGNRVQALFQSNEDMLEFDPHDYDLIQAREENLELIDKKLEEMINIQKKMKEICSYHPIVEVDIFDYFGIGKKEKDEKNNLKDNLNNNQKENENQQKENLNNKKQEEKKGEDNKNEANQNKEINNIINDNPKKEDNQDILKEIEL